MLTTEKQTLGDISHEVKFLEQNKELSKYKIYIKVPFEFGWVEDMKFLIWNQSQKQEVQMDYIENKEGMSYFEADIHLETSAVYHYCFSYKLSGRFAYYKRKNLSGDENVTDKECWKLSVGFESPKWAKDAVMYHIFVDRFRMGKNTKLKPLPNRTIHKKWTEKPVIGKDKKGRWNVDFFGGNLKGIEEKLDYIQSLGTNIIYLSPIVKSQSNHRYDTADYEEVDPYAGSNKDLQKLCEKAHEKGMYVVLDAVFNHTGNDSKYFNEYGNYDTVGAFQSTESPYYNFYRRIQSEDGKEYFDYWWDMKNLPVCNGYSPEWKNYILGEGGVIDKWFNLGIDGLRLDVADELTDEFIEGIRTAVHRNKKDGLVIGEVWKNPMRMNRGYLSSGKGMDSVMDYLLVDALIRYYKYADVEKLKGVVNEILTEYPEDTIHTLMNFTSTHDISRLIEICGCDCFQKNGEWAWNLEEDTYEFAKKHKITKKQIVNAKNILKSYIAALCFMPGIFSIFYGDEVGLTGIGNLMNRSTYPWDNQDKELLEFFKTLGNLKNKYKFLSEAGLKLIAVTNEGLMFERKGKKNLLIVASRIESRLQISLPDEYQKGKVVFSANDSTKDILGAYGVIVVEK